MEQEIYTQHLIPTKPQRQRKKKYQPLTKNGIPQQDKRVKHVQTTLILADIENIRTDLWINKIKDFVSMQSKRSRQVAWDSAIKITALLDCNAQNVQFSTLDGFKAYHIHRTFKEPDAADNILSDQIARYQFKKVIVISDDKKFVNKIIQLVDALPSLPRHARNGNQTRKVYQLYLKHNCTFPPTLNTQFRSFCLKEEWLGI